MKIKLFLPGTLVLLTIVSCDKFLDLTPISSETTATSYNSANQIEAALTGTYQSFMSAQYYVWDNVNFQDVRSDNCYSGGDDPEITSIDALTITPTNSRLFTNWGAIFNAIAKANTVLDNLPNVHDVNLTDTRRAQIKGEALFLRAYHYYNLVNMWGGVPLILSSVTSADPSIVDVPRASVQEVFNQILIDLDNAIALLPDTFGTNASVNKVRATSGAANALAAKACMQQPTPDYARALNYIAKVESSAANYQLIDYAQLFDGNHYFNAESIIEVPYTSSPYGSYGPEMLLPPSITGDTWRKFATPSHDLINAFNLEGDVVRLNASVKFEAAPWVDQYWGDSINSIIPFAYKWKQTSSWSSPDHVYLIRFADILLLKAEALNETGDINDAVSIVNQIRARVNLPALTSNKTSSQSALQLAILNERRLELAFEAQRWDDLVRNQSLISTMSNLVEINLTTNQPVVYGMTQAKILLPLPQQELDINPALTQNPL